MANKIIETALKSVQADQSEKANIKDVATKDILQMLKDLLKNSKDFYIVINTTKVELEQVVKALERDIDVMNIFRKYLSVSLSKISCNEFISDEEYFKIKEWLFNGKV